MTKIGKKGGRGGQGEEEGEEREKREEQKRGRREKGGEEEVRGERGRYEETISITINKPVLRDELQDVGHSIACFFFFFAQAQNYLQVKGNVK